MILRYCDTNGRRKVAYTTWADAAAARDRLRAKRPDPPGRPLRIVLCGVCGSYHCQHPSAPRSRVRTHRSTSTAAGLES